jgi:exodeoxyribonuclease V gamma subunit
MLENLQLKTSNRLEHLLEAWVARLREEPLPPFEREVVVVQSQGMRRWLTLELARRRGIAAGLWMPFPRDLARCLATAVLEGRLDYQPARREMEPFDREVLLWRIYRLLGQLDKGGEPSLRVPAAYLAGDEGGRKRFQLAARLAGLFDDYQLFRPDWLREIEAGRPLFEAADPRQADSRQESAAWQAWLWRRLQQEGSGEHLARRLQATVEKLLESPAGKPLPLPQRITVFGVSSLPPVFLELLRAASLHLPVEIYFASPTWHYWGDLFSDREQVRLARRFRRRDAGAPAGDPLAAGHFERGHSLLSALGGQGRDFFNLLQELDASGEAWHEVDFEDPGCASVLGCLQSDILNLRDRGGSDPPLPLSPGDRSLRVHVCHSPLREMEVLREEILHAFEEMPGLRPSEVLVLLPEIEKYAPLVDAVFGIPHLGAPPIPYAVADRDLASTQQPAAALLALLELAGKRLTVAEIFGLLESPPLRRAAGIEESELGILRSRVQAVGIRWAIDGRQRQEEFGLPAFEEASWQAGIDRLLFGYAIGNVEALSCGIAPAAGDGAGDTGLLGRFLLFLDRLFAELKGLRRGRPAAQWSRDLIALVGRQLAAGDDEEELALQLLRESFARLAELEAFGAFPEDLPLEVIRQFLRRELADDQKSGGFLSGGITFCALRPMRSIPFRLVAVAGLDDASFPRREPPRAFDLLAAAPRPGDRSPRADDRYLFLETLLAARERLLLFYPGASQRDAAEKAPSVVVAELLDLIDRSFAGQGGRPARELLVERHPLQAWSAANFDPARPSSSRENAEASRALAAPREEMPPFVPPDFRATIEDDGPLPPAPLSADGEGGEPNNGFSVSGGGARGRAQPPATIWHPPGAEENQRGSSPDPHPGGVPERSRWLRPSSDATTGEIPPDPHPGGVPEGSRWLRPSSGATTGEPEGGTPSQYGSPPSPSAERGAGGRGPLIQPLEIRLDELIDALSNPSAYFCRHVLQIELGRDEQEALETEPFGLEPLPRFSLLAEMLDRRLGGADPDSAAELELLRARFELPPALLGEANYRRLRLEVETLLGRLPAGLRLPEKPLPFALAGNGWLLRGSLPLRGSALLRVRPATLRPRDLFGAFVEGLAVRAVLPGELRVLAIGNDGGCELRPAASPAHAAAALGNLAAAFRELCRRPLPLFEKASFAYAEQRQRLLDPRKLKTAGAEIAAARRAFEGDERRPGDRDAATLLLWRGRDPLAESDFAAWAEKIFLPLLAARRELR